MSISYKDLEDAYNRVSENPGPSLMMTTLGSLRQIAKRFDNLRPDVLELLNSELPDTTVVQVSESWCSPVETT